MRSHMRAMLKALALFLGLAVLAPIAVSAALWAAGDAPRDWWSADRSSAGLLAPASAHRPAAIRVFSARTVSWRGVVASHSWLVLKEEGAPRWRRFDATAWGAPVRVDGFAPDGRWFGATPQLVFAADGEAAAQAIPKIRAAIERYPFARIGDYRAWPGPNSNTFVAAALAAAPELGARLPGTAIGRDFPHDGRWFVADAQGLRATLGGVIALDWARPAIELPGLGRLGMAPA